MFSLLEIIPFLKGQRYREADRLTKDAFFWKNDRNVCLPHKPLSHPDDQKSVLYEYCTHHNDGTKLLADFDLPE